MCDWFVDNKLSVHFDQENTKPVLFGTKHKLRNAKPLNIVYNSTEIQKCGKVKYLGYILDRSLPGESVALNVNDKVNLRLKFLLRQNRFLTPPLSRLLCNAVIQTLFNNASTAWISNLSKRLKLRFQASQNKCIRYYFQLDKRSKICVKKFLQ